MDSTGAGIIRAGLDVIVTVIVCGVLFIVLPLVPKGQTPSARNKKKKTWPDGGKANINLAGMSRRRRRRRWCRGGGK